MISREMCAAAIIKHYHLILLSTRSWIKYLNLDAISISRNTAKADVFNIHIKEKENIKQRLAGIRNRICLISNLWRSYTIEGSTCLTTHFVDLNWKLNSKIFNFCHMPPPNSGFNCLQKFKNF